LGENLTKDEQAASAAAAAPGPSEGGRTTRVSSVRAIETAREVAQECERGFVWLEEEISSHTFADGDGKGNAEGKQKWVDRVKARMRYSMQESQIGALRLNLDRLKSTMVLMLNVLIHAEQIKR
jgi:hypothetical protein